MGHDMDGGASAPSFLPLTQIIETHARVEESALAFRVQQRMQENRQRISDLVGWGKSKGDQKLAIVAGGPSLKETLAELRQCDRIMVCGSAHDFIVKQGFYPDYAVICDPEAMAADFIKEPLLGTKYLVASACHTSVWDALEGYDTYMWHSAGAGDLAFDGEAAIGGGCTTTLRALSIAVLLGFWDLHFFGFDSSFAEKGREHSYSHSFGERDVIEVQLNGKRVFLSTPEYVAQAQHFQEMCKNFGHLFNATIYGDGLIAAMAKPA